MASTRVDAIFLFYNDARPDVAGVSSPCALLFSSEICGETVAEIVLLVSVVLLLFYDFPFVAGKLREECVGLRRRVVNFGQAQDICNWQCRFVKCLSADNVYNILVCAVCECFFE